MDFNDTKDELNTLLGDAGDVTFTPEEKTRALTKAWNDQYVVRTLWDSTLSYAQSTYRYLIPSALTTIKDIYVSRSNSTQDEPEPISSDLWEVVDGYIQFLPGTSKIIPDGYTLYVKGNYKLTVSDTIADVNLQEYVIALAGVNTLTLLGYKKANLFLKNDTTMGELITLRRELQRDLTDYRQRLTKDYEGS